MTVCTDLHTNTFSALMWSTHTNYCLDTQYIAKRCTAHTSRVQGTHVLEQYLQLALQRGRLLCEYCIFLLQYLLPFLTRTQSCKRLQRMQESR
jgi:hypothetical protein